MAQYKHLIVPLPDKEDWEGRYRDLFDRHETFVTKLCKLLGLNFLTTSENDILQKIEEDNNVS